MHLPDAVEVDPGPVALEPDATDAGVPPERSCAHARRRSGEIQGPGPSLRTQKSPLDVSFQQYAKADHRRADSRSVETMRKLCQQKPFWKTVCVASFTPASAMTCRMYERARQPRMDRAEADAAKRRDAALVCPDPVPGAYRRSVEQGLS